MAGLFGANKKLFNKGNQNSIDKELANTKYHEDIKIEDISKNIKEAKFCEYKKLWNDCKKIAIEDLNQNENKLEMYRLAYNQKYDEVNQYLKNLENISPSSESVKNHLGLTPLIYAIWGEDDCRGGNSNQNEKKVTVLILKFIYGKNIEDIIKETDESSESKSKNFKNYSKNSTILTKSIINELGHLLLYNFKSDINQQWERFWYQEIITNDSTEALEYLMQQDKISFEIYKFNHPKCLPNKKYSIIAFAIIIKSIKCVTLLLRYLDHIYFKSDQATDKKNKDKILKLIEIEIEEYFSFNNQLINKLIENLTLEKLKNLKVNINNIPLSKYLYYNGNDTEIEALKIIETDMEYKEHIMKCTLIYSIIKLPCESGTKESLYFLHRLCRSENLNLFKIPLIKLYLQCKWEILRKYIIIESFLMWLNIILVILLIYDFRLNISLLIFCTLLNTILVVFDLLQIYSTFQFQYLDYVNRKYHYLVIRSIFVLFIFWPNVYIQFTLLYLLISIPFVSGIKFKDLMLTVICFIAFLGLIFFGFWAQWESYKYFIAGIWPLIAISLLVFVYKYDKYKIIFNFSVRFLQLALILVILFIIPDNIGVIILSILFTIITFFIQSSFVFEAKFWNTNFKDKKMNLLILAFDFIVIIIFSVNFYTDGVEAYFSVNSLSLVLTIISLILFFYNEHKKLEIDGKTKVFFKIASIFFTVILLGFNINDSLPIKIFVIFLEFIIFLFFKCIKKISLKKILKHAISMILSTSVFNIARSISSCYWIVNQLRSTYGATNEYIFLVLVLIRGLKSFRCFSITRYYTRLIINSLLEALPFIVIFFYSTLSFGIICAIYDDIDLEEIWIYSYDLNIGATSHNSTDDMNYISFLIATIINVIIMLNLLISILGDSFDRFQVNSTQIDLYEMAQTLLEFENMIIWRRRILLNEKENEIINNSRESKKAFIVGLMNSKMKKNRKGKITTDEFSELIKAFDSLEKNIKTIKFKEN